MPELIEEEQYGRPNAHTRRRKDGGVNVKILMAHEMETGQRKDSAGKPIPAHFIQHVSATWKQGRAVATWGPAIAKTRFWNSASRAEEGR